MFIQWTAGREFTVVSSFKTRGELYKQLKKLYCMSIHSYTDVKNSGYFSLENWTDVIFSPVCFRYTFVNSTVSITTGKEIPRSFRLNDPITVKVKLDPWQNCRRRVWERSANSGGELWTIECHSDFKSGADTSSGDLRTYMTQHFPVFKTFYWNFWLFHVYITVFALISKFKNVIAYMYIITLVEIINYRSIEHFSSQFPFIKNLHNFSFLLYNGSKIALLKNRKLLSLF